MSSRDDDRVEGAECGRMREHVADLVRRGQEWSSLHGTIDSGSRG